MSYRAMTRHGDRFRFLRRSVRLALYRQRDGLTIETKDDACCICLVADRRYDGRVWDEYCCLRCTASICPDCLPRWLRGAEPLRCPLCRFGMRCSGCAPPPPPMLPPPPPMLPWIAPPPIAPLAFPILCAAAFAFVLALDFASAFFFSDSP